MLYAFTKKMQLSVVIVLVLVLVGSNNSTSDRVQGTSLQDKEDTTSAATKKVLNLLVTAPLPPSDGGWDGGLATIPAVRLALKQINKHPDILPGYNLRAIEDNSGCQEKPTTSISFMQNIFYSGLNFVGIIGPGCSASTIELAPILATPNVSLIQIAPAATSPQIAALNQSTTFTMRAPLQMVENTVNLLKRNNWTRFALLYDPSRTIFKTLHDVIIVETNKNNIVPSYDSIVVDDKSNQGNIETYFPFEGLKESRSRVIVLVVDTRTVQRLMCVALHKGMVYPTYQWILLEKSLDGLMEEMEPFIANGVNYSCTQEQMATALNGSILTEYVLRRKDDAMITPLNIRYSEYRELYKEEFLCYLNESRIKNLIKASNQSTEYFIRDDNWENPYYDAAWVFGLALNEVANRGIDLTNYRYGQPAITSAILEEFYKIKFQGASSLIQFTPARNVASPIITNVTRVNGSDIQTDFLCLHNGSGWLSCIGNYSAIHDHFEEVPHRMHPSVGVLVIVCSLATVVFMAALQIAIAKYSERKSVKASSPNLSHLIFSGCYLYCIATVLYTLQQILPFYDAHKAPLLYSVLCNAVMWCVVVGASLIFGTILVKVWRVFRIFRHFSNERPGMILTDQALILGVLFLVVVDVIFCTSWSSLDPYFLQAHALSSVHPTGTNADIIPVNLQCECNNVYVWIGIVLGLKGPIIILVVIFATLNRKIQRKHFSHTKKVNILVYSLTIICGAGFPLFFVLLELSDSVYVSLIFCFILLTSVIVCCLLLFIPPLRNLNTDKRMLSLTALCAKPHQCS